MYIMQCQKDQKQTPKLSENSRNKRRSNRFHSALVLLPFLTVALHESGTRKTISWSVTEYTKMYPVNAN